MKQNQVVVYQVNVKNLELNSIICVKIQTGLKFYVSREQFQVSLDLQICS